jgi:hypothetical protein
MLFFLVIDHAYGQYAGGNGGGNGYINIATNTCATSIDEKFQLYLGGNGGGNGKLQIANNACATNISEINLIYSGGNGGGDGKLQIANTACIYLIDNSVLMYQGGDGGSSSILAIKPTTCAIPEPMNIFTGGTSTSSAAANLKATVANNLSGMFLTTLSDTTIINGNCITLTTRGNGATTYSWSPSIGLNNANIASPIANPSSTTTYTVTGTGGTDGCRNTTTVTINVLDNNGATSITYPSKISNTLTTLQEVTLTGITNGVFSASSVSLKVNSANGLITPNTSSVGVYTVTYTYGTCSNTSTATVEITNGTNVGTIDYQNIFKGGSSATTTTKSLLTQEACSANLDYSKLFYVGGSSAPASTKSLLIQGACIPTINYTLSIYAGGNSSSLTTKSLLVLGACTPNIDYSKAIYLGGSSASNTASGNLVQAVCSVPVGNNFYVGGSGSGYGNGSLTPTTGVVTGTAVGVSSDVTICPSVATSLLATGATNYTWTPATGLSNTLVANPIATPITTTTYTVVGSGAGVGCLNTAKVTVNVLQDLSTTVSYGAYNFDESDMNLKKVNYINGPLNGTFSYTPTGLSFSSSDGSFTPGLSTSQAYTISYNYTKGICNYTYAANINITKLPPIISYISPSIFYINNDIVQLAATNIGGEIVRFELLDALPAGLNLNTTNGTISGTPTILVDNLAVRIRALNYKRDGSENWSENTTLVLSVKKPTITLAITAAPSLNTTYGIPSTNTNFTVQGANIISFINVVAPAGFEVSTQPSTGYGTTIKMYATAEHEINQPIYVRLQKTASVGNHDGNILFTSNSADEKQVATTTSYVAPANLTITGRYLQKFFGSKLILGAGSKYYTTTGLVNDEAIGSVTITSTGGTETADPVGFYSITPSAAVGGTFSSSNYNITYVAGQLEVLYSLYNFNMSGTSSNWVQGNVPVPKINDLAVSNLDFTSATVSGKIPASVVNIDEIGVCYATTINPTTSSSKVVSNSTSAGVFSVSLTGLARNTRYFARAYIKVGNKVFYSPNIKVKTVSVGDPYQGGYLAHIFTSGQTGYVAGEIHGFIIQKKNLGNIRWHNGSAVVTGATISTIGGATSNTNLIVSVQGNGTYAAKACLDLIEGGYDDWVFPTLDELKQIRSNSAYFPTFPTGEYISSTEYNSGNAYKITWPGSNVWWDGNKATAFPIRAIRYF